MPIGCLSTWNGRKYAREKTEWFGDHTYPSSSLLKSNFQHQRAARFPLYPKRTLLTGLFGDYWGISNFLIASIYLLLTSCTCFCQTYTQFSCNLHVILPLVLQTLLGNKEVVHDHSFVLFFINAKFEEGYYYYYFSYDLH